MTKKQFRDIISKLVDHYKLGIKTVETFKQLKEMHLQYGICNAALAARDVMLFTSKRFIKYKPSTVVNDDYWFPIGDNYSKYSSISWIKDKCLKPRLRLLKRILKDLDNEL